MNKHKKTINKRKRKRSYRRRRTYKAGMLKNASKGISSGIISVAKTKAQDELLRKNNRVSNVFNEVPNTTPKKFNVLNTKEKENWKNNAYKIDINNHVI